MRGKPQPYVTAMARILESAAIPYGITLTVWGSGAALAHFRGQPKLYEIFLFLLGGMGGYALLTTIFARSLQRTSEAHPGVAMALTGTLHFLAIGGAVGAVALVANIKSWIAWPLGGMAGIALYLALAALEYSVAPLLPLARGAERDDRESD
jgi:hypothetical protein